VIDQRAVDRNEAQAFHGPLREEQPGERIAHRRFRLGVRQHMARE